ncbi:MAG: class I SAM-dependent methyltransferase [Bdellovibrionales bacterium]|nr:class I SAM-dependent methyltransferase [Bdellovibrionales bacterium]
MSDAWYLHWFGEEYLDLYAHRDDSEADRQVDFLVGILRSPPAARFLDTACGRGRHVRALAERGFRSVGIDRSASALRIGRESLTTPNALLLEADMRWPPFADSVFDGVLSMFTSFGYFMTDEEHLALLRSWRRVMRLGGSLVIDYLNRPFVETHLEPYSEAHHGTKLVRLTRQLSPDGSRVEKHIHLEDQVDGATKTFIESVRMYRPSELGAMLSAAGLSAVGWFGDFSGSPLDDHSERCIVHAERRNG